MNIAIVEDDQALAERLVEHLGSLGTEARIFGDAASFLAAQPMGPFDTCIIDLVLPGGMTGQRLIRALRARGESVPILVLTALDRESDIIEALESGADDYIAKPARLPELHARLKALQRRANPREQRPERVEIDGFTFDARRSMVTVQGEAVVLSEKEFKVGLILMQNLGRPVSRSMIQEAVWGRESNVQTRTMDTHVSRVRAKLGLRPENGYMVSAVYSHGYRLEKLERGQKNGSTGASA